MALIRVACAAVCLVLIGASGLRGEAKTGLARSIAGTGAAAVLVDVGTGRVVDRVGAVAGEAAPGSVLKPFFLLAALEASSVREGTEIECRGDLSVAGRNLACTHPRRLTVFAARDALAYSCNTYFAHVAEATSSAVLVRGLEEFGLHGAGVELTPEARVLLVLGLRGVQVTPLQLAFAYRQLAVRFAKASDAHQPLGIVRDGLAGSVEFGMADNASVPGLVVEGKNRDGERSWADLDAWLVCRDCGGAAAACACRLCSAWERGGCSGACAKGSAGDAEVRLWRLGPLGLALAVAGVAFGQASLESRAAARDLTVRLFDTERVDSLVVTPVHAGASWKGCRTCVTKAFQDPRTIRFGVAKGMIEVAGEVRVETGSGKRADLAGIWRIDSERDGLRVRVTLPSERYVAAVLTAEAASDEPPAALRALAITVRSFALDRAARGEELCDSTRCQAMRLGSVSAAVQSAVLDTSGETLWFRGARVPGYFNQNNGGAAEDAAAAWGGSQRPWLPAHDDAFSERVPSAWHAEVAADELRSALASEGFVLRSPVMSVAVVGENAFGTGCAG